MKRQRWISILLALVLVLGMFTTPASAADEYPSDVGLEDPANSEEIPEETDEPSQEAPPTAVSPSNGTLEGPDGETGEESPETSAELGESFDEIILSPVFDEELPEEGLEVMPLDDPESVEVSEDSVTVSFTSQGKGAFLMAPQTDVTVDAGLAESYGYTDEVTDGVSALDVLVKAHELLYGTTDKDTVNAKLTMSSDEEHGNYVMAMFGESTTNCGFMLDHTQQFGKAITEVAVKDGAFLEFFLYTQADGGDYYLEYRRSVPTGPATYDPFGTLYETYNANLGTFVLGYPVTQFGCSSKTVDEQAQAVELPGVQHYFIDGTTLTEVPGLLSGSSETASGTSGMRANVATAGNYHVTGKFAEGKGDGRAVLLSYIPMVVHDVPQAKDFQVWGYGYYDVSQDVSPSEREDVLLKLTPEFDPSTRSYQVALPDYMSSVRVDALSQTGTRYSMTGTDGSSDNRTSFRSISNQEYLAAYSGNSGYYAYFQRVTTLTSLEVPDGIAQAEFNPATREYTFLVDKTAETTTIQFKPKGVYDIKINGNAVPKNAASGYDPYQVLNNWDENDEVKVTIELSCDTKGTMGGKKYDGHAPETPFDMYLPNTYTITLKPLPQESTPTIQNIQTENGEYILNTEAGEVEPLRILATASGTVAYQWYTCDVSNEGDKTNEREISGATSASYTPKTDALGTVHYFCRVTNTTTNDTADSEVATITIFTDPTPFHIVVTPQQNLVTYDWTELDVPQPTNLEGTTTGFLFNRGDTAALPGVTAETAVGEEGTLSYRWYRYTDKECTTGLKVISGNSFATTVSDATDDGYWYICQVTCTYHGKSYYARSEPYYVYVLLDEVPAPVIKLQNISDATVKQNQVPTVSLALTSVSGSVTPTYQWYVNTTNDTTTGTPIEGATAKSLSTSYIDTTQLGVFYYYCIATSTRQGKSASDTSKVAKITVESSDDPALQVTFTGEGTQDSPYELSTTEDFVKLQTNVNAGISFEGRYFTLTQSVTLPEDWVGLGGTLDGTIIYFSGSIEGNHNKITIPKGCPGIIRYAREAEVKNLRVYGEEIINSAILQSLTVDYGPDGDYSTGCPDPITIDNVTLETGSKTRYSGFVGGGVGSGANRVTIQNSTVEAGVIIGYDKLQSGLGSFSGSLNGYIRNCVSYADVYGTSSMGGIAGSKGQSMGPCSIVNCEFYGTVNASKGSAGGIIASGYNSESAPNAPAVSVINCLVAGTVRGVDYVGGILGTEPSIENCWANGVGGVRDCVFYGTIEATGSNVGGIVGYLNSFNKYQILDGNFYLVADGLDGIGRVKHVITVNDQTYPTYGIDYDFEATRGELCKALTAEEFKSSDVVNSLNSGKGGYQNWTMGTNYPIHSGEAVLTGLTISGDYKTTYYIGDTLDTTGMVFTATWSDGKTQTIPVSEVSITGFDNTTRAVQTLTASYGAAKAEFEVTVLLRPVSPTPGGPATNTITVYFTLLGDVIHDQDEDGHGIPTANGGPHTLQSKNLQTWIARDSYTVDINATVWDVIQPILAKNHIEADTNEGLGTTYIVGLKREGGEWLSEFTNGSNSGWMFTLNGEHPTLGIAQQFLNNNDEIIFHYTDDYTQEKDSEQWTDPGPSGAGTTTPGTTTDPGTTDPEPSESKPVATVTEVKDGTATTTVNSEALAESLKDTDATTPVVIHTEIPDGEEIEQTVAVLTRGDVGAVAEKETSLKISTPLVEIVLSNEALRDVAGEKGQEKEVVTITAAVQENGTSIQVAVNDKVLDKIDGSLLVTLPSAPEELGTGSVMVLVDADGKETVIKKSVQSKGGITALLNGSCTVKVVDNAANFSDTAQHWASGAIDFVSSRKLFIGTSPSVFDPGGNMTRSMLVTVLHRLEDTPDVSTWNSFGDVAGGTWYTDAVSWASENGIVNGYSKGVFAPDNNVTREQIAVMIYRYASFLGMSVSERDSMSEFTDTSSISSWASEAMEWAVGVGLMEGKDGGVLDPGGNATRAEVATILQRLVSLIVL